MIKQTIWNEWEKKIEWLLYVFRGCYWKLYMIEFLTPVMSGAVILCVYNTEIVIPRRKIKISFLIQSLVKGWFCKHYIQTFQSENIISTVPCLGFYMYMVKRISGGKVTYWNWNLRGAQEICIENSTNLKSVFRLSRLLPYQRKRRTRVCLITWMLANILLTFLWNGLIISL